VYKAQAKPSQAKSQEPKTGGRERGVCQAMKSSLNISRVLAKWLWAGLHVHNRPSNLPIPLHVLQIAYKILFIAFV